MINALCQKCLTKTELQNATVGTIRSKLLKMKIENPAFDYDNNKHDYAQVRRADKRIFSYVQSALVDFNTVINVGAGTGSYEPQDKYVISVEPSSVMRKKRLALGRNPAINAFADSLPFEDMSFDVSLAILTIHHWPDLRAGLEEIKRVTRSKIVILTYDPERLADFWNVNYFPKVVEVESKRYPVLGTISSILGSTPKVSKIRIPFDCTDGFQEAFYGRPEFFLKEEVRQAQSAWGFIEKDIEHEYVEHLRSDIQSGEWDRLYGFHREMPFFEGAYRMLEFNLTGAST